MHVCSQVLVDKKCIRISTLSAFSCGDADDLEVTSSTDLASTVSGTAQASIAAKPKKASKEIETPPPSCLVRTDYDLYYEWEERYLPIMQNVPEALTFEINPFVSFDFEIGPMPTGFDTMAFLKSID